MHSRKWVSPLPKKEPIINLFKKSNTNNTDPDATLAVARKVLDNELEAVSLVHERLGTDFLTALELLKNCGGKIIVTGLGKSGIAAQKIAATLTSTGTPSLFMHAAEAVHGDIGVVMSGDVAFAISYSGETKELNELLPRFRLLGVPIIALTGNTKSGLAKLADAVLDVSVPSYPWPYGVLPTASIASTVAVGDALAVALLDAKGIREEDFALLHPGGLLGRKLLVKVSDLMHTGEELPVVGPNSPMSQALVEMTGKLLGMTCVVDDEGRLQGIITDGDLRRLLEKHDNPMDKTAADAMTKNPKWIAPDRLAARALHEMESHAITSLPVCDDGGVALGVIHVHDILKPETGS